MILACQRSLKGLFRLKQQKSYPYLSSRYDGTLLFNGKNEVEKRSANKHLPKKLIPGFGQVKNPNTGKGKALGRTCILSLKLRM